MPCIRDIAPKESLNILRAHSHDHEDQRNLEGENPMATAMATATTKRSGNIPTSTVTSVRKTMFTRSFMGDPVRTAIVKSDNLESASAI